MRVGILQEFGSRYNVELQLVRKTFLYALYVDKLLLIAVFADLQLILQVLWECPLEWQQSAWNGKWCSKKWLAQKWMKHGSGRLILVSIELSHICIVAGKKAEEPQVSGCLYIYVYVYGVRALGIALWHTSVTLLVWRLQTPWLPCPCTGYTVWLSFGYISWLLSILG